jgi:hypothetical protein
MLAPLAVFLLIMLIACTLTLLICWVYDTVQPEIEARQSGSADLHSPVIPIRGDFRRFVPRWPTRRATDRDWPSIDAGPLNCLARRGNPAAPEKSYYRFSAPLNCLA